VDSGAASNACGCARRSSSASGPFDRLVVATAMTARARLVTADANVIAFAKSAGLKLVEL
jgi:PIN domain nuclease of toxin-antitoxin system